MQKIINLGCKLNQYEGFCLAKKFAGTQDLIIVNTCCVTREAATKSLRKFRSSKRQYPNHRIIATGCACRLAPEKFKMADQVIDNVQRNELIKGVFPTPEKSRYFLKIQDGCNEVCSYCIVAKLRDKVESKPIKDIIEEIGWAVSRDYQEVVLVGANIGLYGSDVGQELIDLLKALSKIPGLPRLRLSSLEPKFVREDLIRCLKDLPFCRHFHLPIQSADKRILIAMKRHYDIVYLKKAASLITRNFNDVALGADIIVGFPGEMEKEFENTYRFIERQPFTHLHIFPYSPRPLTSAYILGDPVDRKVKRQRLWRLKDLIKNKNYEFRKHLLGKSLDLVIEGGGGVHKGLTDNYIRVVIEKSNKAKKALVRVTKVTEDKTFGVVI